MLTQYRKQSVQPPEQRYDLHAQMRPRQSHQVSNVNESYMSLIGDLVVEPADHKQPTPDEPYKAIHERANTSSKKPRTSAKG